MWFSDSKTSSVFSLFEEIPGRANLINEGAMSLRLTFTILIIRNIISSKEIYLYNDCRYMKIIYMHNGEETNIRDPRSYEQYWIIT